EPARAAIADGDAGGVRAVRVVRRLAVIDRVLAARARRVEERIPAREVGPAERAAQQALMAGVVAVRRGGGARVEDGHDLAMPARCWRSGGVRAARGWRARGRRPPHG